jgi:hypothetical protein
LKDRRGDQRGGVNGSQTKFLTKFGLYPKINPDPQHTKSSGADTGEATLAVPWRDSQSQKEIGTSRDEILGSTDCDARTGYHALYEEPTKNRRRNRTQKKKTAAAKSNHEPVICFRENGADHGNRGAVGSSRRVARRACGKRCRRKMLSKLEHRGAAVVMGQGLPARSGRIRW